MTLDASDGALDLGSRAAVRAALVERAARGELVAWVRGPVEIGQHSPGRRLVLCDATRTDAVRRLLEAVGRNEPFARARIAVPCERAGELFDVPSGCEHALRRAQVRLRSKGSAASRAPALLAADGTARVQVVDASDDPDLHAVLTAFGERTGAPLAALATFRIRGQPAVRTGADAMEAFRAGSLDALIVERHLVTRD